VEKIIKPEAVGGKSLRRSRFDIIGEILSLTKDGAVKTSIVYRANLNFNVVNRYLNLLLHEGLVSATKGSTVKYKITKKGIEFLDAYKNLKNVAENL
jgi:predicted transcriptional regulator